MSITYFGVKIYSGVTCNIKIFIENKKFEETIKTE